MPGSVPRAALRWDSVPWLQMMPRPNNSWALWAYYLGLASLICGIFAGIPAFVAGVKGVQFAKKNPQAKGAIHAWFGILAGAVMFLLNVALLILIISSN